MRYKEFNAGQGTVSVWNVGRDIRPTHHADSANEQGRSKSLSHASATGKGNPHGEVDRLGHSFALRRRFWLEEPVDCFSQRPWRRRVSYPHSTKCERYPRGKFHSGCLDCAVVCLFRLELVQLVRGTFRFQRLVQLDLPVPQDSLTEVKHSLSSPIYLIQRLPTLPGTFIYRRIRSCQTGMHSHLCQDMGQKARLAGEPQACRSCLVLHIAQRWRQYPASRGGVFGVGR